MRVATIPSAGRGETTPAFTTRTELDVMADGCRVLVSTDKQVSQAEHEMHYVQLDRQGCETLIRALVEARDRAFPAC